MAFINKLITLTEKGKSGPYYDIAYSSDCSTFIIAPDGNDVYLPSLNSTAVVTIPDDTQCIRLTSVSGECTNSVTSGSITPPTTTTTTTTAPTTTTTTTTTVPSGAQYFTYRVERVDSDSSVSITYTDPYYKSQTHTWSSGVDRFIVARSIDASSNATVTGLSQEARPFMVSSSEELNLNLAFDTTVSNTATAFQHLYYIDYNTGLPDIDVVISGQPQFNGCVVSGSLMLGKGTETSGGVDRDAAVSWSFGSSCATTTTTTTAPPDCYTYYIENYDLGDTLTYRYRDCNGDLVEDNVVLPDTTTPEFCAQSGSVTRQGGTTAWTLVEEDTTCVPPTTTTTSTTTAPTPQGSQYGTHTANIPGTVVGDGVLVWQNFSLGARNWVIAATGESSPIQNTWYTINVDGADVYSSAGFHINDISTTSGVSECKWFFDGIETVVEITDCATTGSQLYSTDNFYYDFYT